MKIYPFDGKIDNEEKSWFIHKALNPDKGASGTNCLKVIHIFIAPAVNSWRHRRIYLWDRGGRGPPW